MITFTDYLETVYTVFNSDLEEHVKQIIIKESECNECFIQELLSYGCVSGVCNNLTYYYQTKEFFRQHTDDILEVFDDLLKMGINFKHDINTNFLAWLAFEETANKLFTNYCEYCYEKEGN